MKTPREERERLARAEQLHRVSCPNRAAAERKRHADIYRLNAADMFDPALSKLYLLDFSEVPDNVKNLPRATQAAYIVTFNRWLAMTGDIAKAMRAGAKAARTKHRQMKHKEKLRRDKARGLDRSASARDLKMHTLNRMERGRRVQIVVP